MAAVSSLIEKLYSDVQNGTNISSFHPNVEPCKVLFKLATGCDSERKNIVGFEKEKSRVFQETSFFSREWKNRMEHLICSGRELECMARFEGNVERSGIRLIY